MESPTTEMFMDNLDSCPTQRKPIAMRAAYCFADNCYRALFPCPSPWVVTEAVYYCATVSAESATNYPTQAIAACGTGKERYISACSCPATNCPINSTLRATTAQGATAQDTAQNTAQGTAPNTAQPVITSAIEDEHTPQSNPTPIVVQPQALLTATGGGVVPTHALSGGTNASDAKPSAGPAYEPVVTGPPTTNSISPDRRVSSANDRIVDEGKSIVESQPTPSSELSLSQPLPTAPGQSLTQLSLLPSVFSPEATSETRSPAPSRLPPTTTTLSPGSAGRTTPANGPRALSVGVIAAIAIGSTLVALLLLGAAAYCCLKRRRGARPRASTLSQENILNQGSNVSSEWKPPVELPHQSTTTPRHVELEESLTPRTQLNEGLSFQANQSSRSSDTSLAPRNAAEMPSRPPHPSPAELFVLPAELPNVDRT